MPPRYRAKTQEDSEGGAFATNVGEKGTDSSFQDTTLDIVQEALGDRYLVTGALAEGGMSTLLRGRQTLLDQPVAIKVMHASLLRDRALRERFLREARILASIRSPHVTSVFDAGTLPDGRLYLVLELLQGENLEQISQRGKVPLAEAAGLLLQVCDGLAAAHQRGIVHRDLKPENVFLTREEGTDLPIVKVLDFGIAKDTTDPNDVTGTYTVLGSPLYMAPEQIASSRSADLRVDIWAMGIMLYQLVLGSNPFEDTSLALLLNKIQNEPLPPFPPETDPLFEVVVERCLAKNPDDRYPDVKELREALLTLSSPPPDSQDPPTLATAAPSFASSRTRAIQAAEALANPASPLAPAGPQEAPAPPPRRNAAITLADPPDQRSKAITLADPPDQRGKAPTLPDPPDQRSKAPTLPDPALQRPSSADPPQRLSVPTPAPSAQRISAPTHAQPQRMEAIPPPAPSAPRISAPPLPHDGPSSAVLLVSSRRPAPGEVITTTQPLPPAIRPASNQPDAVRRPGPTRTEPLVGRAPLRPGRGGTMPLLPPNSTPQFAEPLPDARRQAPTVIVPRGREYTWPLVAIVIAVILVSVAVYVVLHSAVKE